MADSVPVRCPECRREHTYTPPVYACACGAPVVVPLLRDGPPVRVLHRTWKESWVSVRCPVCSAEGQWPQPELGCGCGTVLRLPVAPLRGAHDAPGARRAERTEQTEQTERTEQQGRPQPASAPRPRPAFRPVTIRTARDARSAAAQYLHWLGFTGVRVTEKRPASGVDLRGPGIVAHVDPTTDPTDPRDVETLWLNGLNESAVAVCFSLAGYAHEARVRADALGVPLFVLDLTGTPRPVNDPAEELADAPR